MKNELTEEVSVINNWNATLNKMFPSGVPKYAVWNDVVVISKVLEKLSAKNTNHIFFPNGGGQDLSRAVLKDALKLKIIINAGLEQQIKPMRLSFHSFANLEWSYFRIQLDRKKSFVIFGKFSPYNKNKDVYDGRHNNYSEKGFSNYIENVIKWGWDIHLSISEEDKA